MNSKNINIICFHGKPCAGKDTQAEKLLNNFPSSVKISTGDIFRGARDKFGRYVEYHDLLKEDIKTVEKGGLIRDHIITHIVKLDIGKYVTEENISTFIFTGFPRTIPQENEFNKMLHDLDDFFNINEINIFLDISNELATSRSLKRRQDDINHHVSPRKEDEPESFKKRLSDFQEKTLPMIINMDKEGRLKTFDGSASVIEIASEIESDLEINRRGLEKR